MIWRVLIVIYGWALVSLLAALWSFLQSLAVPCPRWVRWVAMLGAVGGGLLLFAALAAGEPLSWGYLVPLTALVFGVWGAVRGTRFRQSWFWRP